MKNTIKLFLILIVTVQSIIFPSEKFDNCFTLIAGRNSTTYGGGLIAHNEDDRGENFFINVHRLHNKTYTIPKIYTLKNGGMWKSSKRNGYLWLEMRGTEFADSYINEHGVVIVSNACKSRENRGEISSGGIGPYLRRIIAEQSQTAREAVRLAGILIGKFGYTGSGRSYAIADSKEGWFLQIVKGKHWVAKRVPDDEVSIIPNYYTIGEINLKDRKNYMGSKDIISYAVSRGWYNPEKDGKFNFRKVYSDKKTLSADYNIYRHWRGIKLLSKLKLRPADKLPFSFKPSKLLNFERISVLLRDHYEGTEYDLTGRYKKGSPNFTKMRTICTDSTQYSLIATLRNELPKEIAPRIWIAFRRPDSNSYSIWYPSINSTPGGYTRGNSENAIKLHFNRDKSYYKFDSLHPYWNYVRLSNKVDNKYRSHIRTVKKMWKNFENFLVRDVKKFEKEFLYIYKKNRQLALNILTGYVHRMEYRRWLKTIDLLKSLR